MARNIHKFKPFGEKNSVFFLSHSLHQAEKVRRHAVFLPQAADPSRRDFWFSMNQVPLLHVLGNTSSAVILPPPPPFAKKFLTFSRRQYILGIIEDLTTLLFETVRKVKRLFEAYYYGFSFAFFYEGTTTDGFAEPLHV